MDADIPYPQLGLTEVLGAVMVWWLAMCDAAADWFRCPDRVCTSASGVAVPRDDVPPAASQPPYRCTDIGTLTLTLMPASRVFHAVCLLDDKDDHSSP